MCIYCQSDYLQPVISPRLARAYLFVLFCFLNLIVWSTQQQILSVLVSQNEQHVDEMICRKYVPFVVYYLELNFVL